MATSASTPSTPTAYQTHFADPAMPLLRQGLELQKTGHMSQAEALYRQALQINPEHGTALHLLGVLLSQTNRAAEAIVVLRQSVAIHPKDATAFHNLASALLATGALEAALQANATALTLNPVYIKAYCVRASIWTAMGRIQLAQADLHRALALEPGNAQVQEQQAALYAQHPHLASAKKDAEVQALEANTDFHLEVTGSPHQRSLALLGVGASGPCPC